MIRKLFLSLLLTVGFYNCSGSKGPSDSGVIVDPPDTPTNNKETKKDITIDKNKLTHIIWGFWDSGEEKLESQRIFNKLNVDHWRAINPGWEVRILNLNGEGDPNDFFEVLKEFGVKNPRSYVAKKWDELNRIATKYYDENGNEVKQNPLIVKSDMARLAILEVAGGVWADTTNVMLEPIKEFFEKEFNESTATVGGYIMDHYGSDHSAIVNGKKIDGMENWLIAAKPGSPLIRKWRKIFNFGYWDQKEEGMQVSKHPLFKEFETPEELEEFFGKTFTISRANYLNQHASLKYALYKNPELNTEIYPIDFNPWRFNTRFTDNKSDRKSTPVRVLEAMMKGDIARTARELRVEGTTFMKFGGDSLGELNKELRSRKDACTKRHMLQDYYKELNIQCAGVHWSKLTDEDKNEGKSFLLKVNTKNSEKSYIKHIDGEYILTNKKNASPVKFRDMNNGKVALAFGPEEEDFIGIDEKGHCFTKKINQVYGWETFIVNDRGDNYFSLLTNHNSYLAKSKNQDILSHSYSKDSEETKLSVEEL